MTIREHQQLVEDLVAELQCLAGEGVPPTEAQARVRTLQARDTGISLELVWIQEAYDDSFHYDALLHVPGEGTLSLGFAPEAGLAWPLRGVQRWHDQDLVRVNNTIMTVDHAIACLDFIWQDASIANRLVDVCLIEEALQQNPMLVSDDELQQALDNFRRAHRLFTAEETHGWMAQNGVSRDKLDRLVRDDATVRKLRNEIAANRVDEYFAEHQDEFATVALLRLEFAAPECARRAATEIRRGTDFCQLARSVMAEALVRGETFPVVQSVVLQKREAALLRPLDSPAPDRDMALFAAQPGDVVGPVRSDRGAALLQVVAQTPARLDAQTREAILRALFDDWLNERRRAARIEWYWGNAAQVATP